VPGQESGALFLLDRKPDVWYRLYFNGEEFRGYKPHDVRRVKEECGLLNLVERPGLLRSGLGWVVRPGTTPVARLSKLRTSLAEPLMVW
jgi:hypothetical protein